MPEEERMASWHLVDGEGHVCSAGTAIAPLVSLMPGGGVPAAVAARMPRLMERAYRWTADHRSGLGKLVTGGASARADATIRARAARPQPGLS
jgi:predicted DCC family thiol-disulfide oxidoreductase YuxK